MRLPLQAVGVSALPAIVTLLSFSAVTAALAASSRPAYAQDATAAAKSQVVVHATWDARFVYLALQVDDTDVSGTNNRPMSNPEQDDSIAVYFHAGPDKPEAPTAKTNMMAVSAAGGFTFQRGDAAAKSFTPNPVFTIKYGVTTQGSLNRSDDRDRGFTAVVAIPLEELGLDQKTLKPGASLAFNAVVRSRSEKPLFTSLSPSVTSERETASPAKWINLVLGAPNAPASADKKTLVARRIKDEVKPPEINGVYKASEWPAASVIAFAAPDIPKPLVAVKPVTPEPLIGTNETVAPPLRLASAVKGLEKRLMARYLLGFQGDLRKLTSPLRGIFSTNGTITLREQPAAGVGPWFTYERTAWHRAQLTDMRRSGIDVALTQVGGPDHETGSADEKALLVMVSALKELTAERIPVPQAALYLDTTALLPKGTAPLDMTKTEDRALLYDSIRRWMTIVPPEFRARVSLPPDAAGGSLVTAYPVFLSDAAALSNTNSGEWADDLRARFAKEFGASTGGVTLLLMGGSGFNAAPAKLAGTIALDTGGISSSAGGGISTFVLRPGRDDPSAPLVPRRGGATYRERWEAAIAANPDWIILDSWNDFANGTAVAASRQYGTQYADETRIFAAQASGFTEKALRWLATDAPRRLRPGQVVNSTMTLQNASGATLRSDEGVRLVYRWMQGGKEVAKSLVPVSVPDSFLPTRTANIPIGVAAFKQQEDGTLTPLPEGDYTLQVDLAKYQVRNTVKGGGTLLSAPEYFSEANPSSALRLPVTISSRAPETIQFSGTTTPPLMLSGGTYPVALRLRWLGNEKLPADAASIVYQLIGEDGKPVTTGTIPLTRTLQPGQWENVIAPLRLTEGGAPIPVACPEVAIREAAKTTQGNGYRLRWLLVRTQSVEPIPGEYTEQVAVYPQDDLARILPSGKIPNTIEADAQAQMTVTVINRGSQKWTKGNFAVGYHWYQPDGLEAVWVPPLTTPLDKDVAPGEQVTLPVLVRAPLRAGEYLLTFDVMRGADTYLSTRPVTPTGDIGLTAIRVTSGKQQFLDLRKLFDIDAVASEAKPGDGNFDGTGATFPAESFPPDPYGIAAALAPNTNRKSVDDDPLYPSGYFTDVSPTARQTWFRYGGENDGAKNAVACKGQQIEAKGRFFGMNIAAAATGGKDVATSFTLTYKDGTSEKIARSIGDWNRAPGASDPIAVSAWRKRTPENDVRAFAGVRHIILPVDVTKELASITLPNDPKVKVFAITLDR